MQPIIHRIGNAITSISAVILVLMLTIVAMIFFSHNVFYETLPDTMVVWERQVAAWAIACSWELTILVVVCNVELLVSKRIPIVLSICSGFVILFFIHAFESDLSLQEYLRRWFIGLLVASINIVFSSLFYRKWCESNTAKTLAQTILDLNAEISERDSELRYSKAKVNELDTKLLEATDYIIELENFKESELKRRTCPVCGEILQSVAKLNYHKIHCGRDPKLVLLMLGINFCFDLIQKLGGAVTCVHPHAWVFLGVVKYKAHPVAPNMKQPGWAL